MHIVTAWLRTNTNVLCGMWLINFHHVQLRCAAITKQKDWEQLLLCITDGDALRFGADEETIHHKNEHLPVCMICTG